MESWRNDNFIVGLCTIEIFAHRQYSDQNVILVYDDCMIHFHDIKRWMRNLKVLKIWDQRGHLRGIVKDALIKFMYDEPKTFERQLMAANFLTILNKAWEKIELLIRIEAIQVNSFIRDSRCR